MKSLTKYLGFIDDINHELWGKSPALELMRPGIAFGGRINAYFYNSRRVYGDEIPQPDIEFCVNRARRMVSLKGGYATAVFWLTKALDIAEKQESI